MMRELNRQEHTKRPWDLKPGDTVVITGGCGFIGCHLAQRLLDDGFKVRVLDNLSTGLSEALPQSPDLELVIGTVMDKTMVQRVTKDAHLVLHMASVVGMRLVEEDPDFAFTVSKTGTETVLRHSNNIPVVLFSSSSVYGLGRSSESMSEKALISRDIPMEYDGNQPGYATGKWELEQLGISAASSGRDILIIRPFNVVGPGQRDAYGMVLPNFIKRVLASEPVEIHDDGHQSRSFADISVFTDVVRKLLGSPGAWQSGGNVFNIGTPKLTSIMELAQIVMEEVGHTVPLEYIEYGKLFPGRLDVRSRQPDISLLDKTLGPVTWPDIRKIVRDSIANQLLRDVTFDETGERPVKMSERRCKDQACGTSVPRNEGLRYPVSEPKV